MKVLTLYQPWAHLVAIGAKRIETRSWSTRYRGTLGIHASANKRFVDMRKDGYLCHLEPFYSALQRDIETTGRTMQFGSIIATCELIECVPIKDKQNHVHYYPNWNNNRVDWFIPPTEPELSFGGYEVGRFAWLLDCFKILPEPIPAKGMLGLWEWRCEA